MKRAGGVLRCAPYCIVQGLSQLQFGEVHEATFVRSDKQFPICVFSLTIAQGMLVQCINVCIRNSVR